MFDNKIISCGTGIKWENTYAWKNIYAIFIAHYDLRIRRKQEIIYIISEHGSVEDKRII